MSKIDDKIIFLTNENGFVLYKRLSLKCDTEILKDTWYSG